MIKILLHSIFLLTPSISFGGFFGPDNYEECILDSMKGVESNIAAKEIKKACRNKFPENKSKKTINNKKYEKLPKDVLSKLSGNAGVDRDETKSRMPTFSGTIENKTRSWVITKITVFITPKDNDAGDELEQTCTAALSSYDSMGLLILTDGVDPLTKGRFYCSDIYAPDNINFNWYIIGAYGYKK